MSNSQEESKDLLRLTLLTQRTNSSLNGLVGAKQLLKANPNDEMQKDIVRRAFQVYSCNRVELIQHIINVYGGEIALAFSVEKIENKIF